MPSRLFILSLIFAGALFYCSAVSAATEPNSTSSDINSATTSLSRDMLSLEERKKLLTTIKDTLKQEISEMRTRLESVEPDENGKKLRESYFKTLEEQEDYLKSLEQKISTSSLSIDDTKNIAREIKDWRQDVYNESSLEITSFLLIFEQARLLNIAKERIAKIDADMAKIKRQRLSSKETLIGFFDQAQKRYELAKNMHEQARELFYRSKEKPGIKENAILNSATTTESEKDEKQPEINPLDLSRDLLKQSLAEITSVYELFLRMKAALRGAK